MTIEECFSIFQQAATCYYPNCRNISFSLSESDEPDFLLCNIAKVIGKEKHRSSKFIANVIVSQLPFSATVLPKGDIKFNLWQEIRRQ